jgi:serine/threonine-protein kinase
MITGFSERFAVERVLGRGAVGEVLLATDTALGRRVAIKRLLPEFVQDATFVQRFFREARIAARLRHPRIVAVHDFGQAPDRSCFVVMELVEGGTLEAALARVGRLDAKAALELLTELADGIAHAHDAGVVHRDLKPGNILLDGGRFGLPKIADFGLAKVISEGHLTLELTRKGMVVGTPAYMAPEQAQGQPATFATDIYAWGCIAYEVLAGRPPFTGATIGEIIRAHVDRAPEWPSAVSGQAGDSRLELLVMQSLVKNPKGRLPNARALVEQLQQLRPRSHSRLVPLPEADAELDTSTSWQLVEAFEPTGSGPPPEAPADADAQRAEALRRKHDEALQELAQAIAARGSAPNMAIELGFIAEHADAVREAEIEMALVEEQVRELAERPGARSNELNNVLADLLYQRSQLLAEDIAGADTLAASGNGAAGGAPTLALIGELDARIGAVRARIDGIERQRREKLRELSSRYETLQRSRASSELVMREALGRLATTVEAWLAGHAVADELRELTKRYQGAKRAVVEG